jgi:hypothetical protein
MRTTLSLPVLGRTVPLWALGLAFVALGLVAYAPYLGIGFSADDFFFVNMLEGAIPYDPLRGFWAGGEGSFQSLGSLWWAQISPEAGFLRLLASWALTLLYRLFGRNAVPYHAALAMLHGLGAFSVFLVLRQVSGRDTPALLAALLFLVCEDHAMTVAWISTITDLLCALFLNLAFLCHIVARQVRKARFFMLSLALFLAAMASKETAAVYPLIVAAYEFFYPQGTVPLRETTGCGPHRPRPALPAGLVGLGHPPGPLGRLHGPLSGPHPPHAQPGCTLTPSPSPGATWARRWPTCP